MAKLTMGTMALLSQALGADVSSCGSGWPMFNSESALRNDPWGNYFEMVYGTFPSFEYPLCIGDFWWFNDAYIEQSGASAPSIVGNCPSGTMDRYVTNSAFQRPGISWSWHPPLYDGFPGNTWIEVSHQQDYGQLSDENFGMWLLYAKGNGIWFNTGMTKTYPEHYQWLAEYGLEHAFPPKLEDASKMSVAAGYDSVQFNRHKDGTNYPCHRSDGTEMNIEIVAVKLKGIYSCGSAPGEKKGKFQAGWLSSLHDCECDESVGYLNCDGNYALSADAVV